jgi:hypothetical protein
MGVVAGLIWLSGILLLAWVVVAGILIRTEGWRPARTALLAAGVCWLFGVLALLSTALLIRVGQPLAGLLSGILFRTGGPLAALAVGSSIPELASAGFPGQVVVFFLVTLAAETVLAVRVTGISWKFTSRR